MVEMGSEGGLENNSRSVRMKGGSTNLKNSDRKSSLALEANHSSGALNDGEII